MKKALGLVEIEGLSTAILVADTMVKTADVSILELENTKGLGWITIKVTGDVGAVNAAVNAGKQIGIVYGHFVTAKVIPRPSDFIESYFCTSKENKKLSEELPKEEIKEEVEEIKEDNNINLELNNEKLEENESFENIENQDNIDIEQQTLFEDAAKDSTDIPVKKTRRKKNTKPENE